MNPDIDEKKLEKAYMASCGLYCPVCESPDIQGTEAPRVEGAMVYQDIECLNCKASWTDVCQLQGICNLDVSACDKIIPMHVKEETCHDDTE
jgi:hypothetical protein